MTLTAEQEDYLTSKPSKILGLALKDFIKCERSKRFTINMACWISWDRDTPNVDIKKNHCLVCLGGAALVQTFKVKSFLDDCNYEGTPFTKSEAIKISRVAYALNNFRRGDVRDALLILKIPMKKINKLKRDQVYVPYHSEDPVAFKAGLKEIIKELESQNL